MGRSYKFVGVGSRRLLVITALVLTSCGGADSASEPSDPASSPDDETTQASTAEPPASDPSVPETSLVDAASEASPAGEANEEAGLTEASLAVAQATSFDRVPVVGVAGPVARDAVVYLVGHDVVPRPVFVDDDGPFIIAPMHPTDIDGGDLELRIETADEIGPTLTLSVSPPPPAAGSSGDAHDALVAAVEYRASSLGTSAHELRAAAFDELDPIARHLKVALSWLDQAADELADLGDDERELLDSITAAATLAEVFAGEAVDLPTDLSFEVREITAAGFRAAPAQSGAACVHNRVSISTVEELSEAMFSASAAGRLSAREGPRGRALEATSWALSAGSFIPGIPGTVASVMSLELAAFDAVMNGLSGLNPSRLTSIRAGVDPTTFTEDSTEIGAWSNVVLNASSTGWIADADAVNVLLNLAGVLAPGPGPSGTIDEVIAGLGDEILVPAGELLNQTLNSELQQLESNIIHFCPENWSIPVNSPGYVEGRALGNRLGVDNAAFTYWPDLVGPDTLRIEALPVKFAGQYAKFDTRVETKAIVVAMIPSLVIVENPGERVTVGATIEWAETPTLVWDAGNGSWDDGVDVDTNGPQDRILKTPTNESAYPFTIRVESTTNTGLRADRTPPRRGNAVVTLKPFELTASPTEMRPGEWSLLEAVDGDGEPVEVTWAWSGGTLDAGGTGTAGFSAIEPGEYVITATNASGESRSVNIFVVGGDCSFAYTIGGTRFIGQEGDVVTWSNRDDDESRLLMGDPTGRAYSTQLTFTTDGSITSRDGEHVTAVGPHDIRFADFTVAGGDSLGASVLNTGSVDITAYEDGVMVTGTGAGTVIDPNAAGADRVPFSFEFAVHDSGISNFGAADFECYIGGPPDDLG